MLLGEAPGETEIHNGIPFSGRAGKQLMVLERIHVTREEVYITSAVRSRPYKWREKKNEMVKSYKKYNRTPNQGEIVAHAPLLDYELENTSEAYRHAWKYRSSTFNRKNKNHRCTRAIIKTAHSKIKGYTKCRVYMVRERISCFPTFHPASIFIIRSLLELIHEDFEKLKRLVIKTRKAKALF